MSMQDPIADMLTRIRNGQSSVKDVVAMPTSKFKVEIAKVLKDEGYIMDYEVVKTDRHPELRIALKYYQGKPVIEKIVRLSKRSLPRYAPSTKIPRILGGLGTVIMSTSRGVMTGAAARKAGVGGEVLCYVA